MEVNVKLRAKQLNIAAAGGPAVVVGLYKGMEAPEGAAVALDAAIGGMITGALKSKDFAGGVGDILVLYPTVAGKGLPERVVLVGLGPKENLNPEAMRKAAGALAGCLRKLKVAKAAVAFLGGDSGGKTADMARGFAEGLLMGLYRYHNYFRDGRAEALVLADVVVAEKLKSRIKGIQGGLDHGSAVGRAVNHARELGNGPGNEVTPTYLANDAKALGKEFGFKVKVLERDQCEKLGMGAFLGVAQGSAEPPKFIIMEYEGRRPKGTVCLVGKGITFDTGGISLKPGQDMEEMKFDMCGAAAVLGTMKFVAERKLPLRVIGLIASTHNMPDGNAYKPGDILTSMGGITIEVKNTDAEGRLILVDTLEYAKRYEPDAVVDLATLTGACVIALGSHACGIMGNDEWLLDVVYDAGTAAGERAWPLPLTAEYREMVKSDVADIKNTAGRAAGAITAGAFLGAFTDDYRWTHMDIAGTAWNQTGKSYLTPGGDGAGVRLLAEMLTGWKNPRGKGPQPGLRTSLRGLTVEKDKPAAEPAKAAPAPGKTTRKKTTRKKTTRKKTARKKS